MIEIDPVMIEELEKLRNEQKPKSDFCPMPLHAPSYDDSFEISNKTEEPEVRPASRYETFDI